MDFSLSNELNMLKKAVKEFAKKDSSDCKNGSFYRCIKI